MLHLKEKNGSLMQPIKTELKIHTERAGTILLHNKIHCARCALSQITGFIFSPNTGEHEK